MTTAKPSGEQPSPLGPQEPVPVTDWLQAVQRAEPAQAGIDQYFKADYLDYARKRISEALQARISPDDLYNAAMKSALSEVRHGRCRVQSRNDFQYLLKSIIKRKAAEEAKKAAAAKRASPTETRWREGVAQDNRLAPPDKASLDEIIMEIVAELASEADEVRRIVTLLGIVHDYPAKSIRYFLEQQHSSEDLPSLRTIQYWIKEKRESLASRHGETGLIGEGG